MTVYEKLCEMAEESKRNQERIDEYLRRVVTDDEEVLSEKEN